MISMFFFGIACDSAPTDTIIVDDTGEQIVEQMNIERSLSLDTSDWYMNMERTKENPLKGFLTSYLWGEPVNDFQVLTYFFVRPFKS